MLKRGRGRARNTHRPTAFTLERSSSERLVAGLNMMVDVVKGARWALSLARDDETRNTPWSADFDIAYTVLVVALVMLAWFNAVLNWNNSNDVHKMSLRALI